jgi:hypothetical protein
MRGLRRFSHGFYVAIGLAASLLAVAQVVGPARRITRNAIEWLYPAGVLIAAAALILALAVALYVATRPRAATVEYGERERERDTRVIAEIRSTLPRGRVHALLRMQDFGNAWRSEWMDAIFHLERKNDVEDRFLDPTLERLRQDLHTAVEELSELFAAETFPVRGAGAAEWQDVGVRAGEDRELWNRRKTLLNEASDRVADAYDALMEEARRKTLI